MYSKIVKLMEADVLTRLERLEADAELRAKQTDHEALLTRMKRLETALVRLFIYRRNNEDLSLHDRVTALELKVRAVDEEHKHTSMRLEFCRSRVQFSKTGCLSPEDVEIAMGKITMKETPVTAAAPAAPPAEAAPATEAAAAR